MNPKSVLGYTDTETVKLDFDHADFKTVKYWALRTMKRFRLGGFIILKSSENSYHVVFNRKVSWSMNMRVVAWISLYSNKDPLRKWFLMQCIKKSSTLRVSPKGQTLSPRIIFRYGEQDGQIQSFLQSRRVIKKIVRKLLCLKEISN